MVPRGSQACCAYLSPAQAPVALKVHVPCGLGQILGAPKKPTRRLIRLLASDG